MIAGMRCRKSLHTVATAFLLCNLVAGDVFLLSDISKIEPLFKHFNPYNHTHLRVSIFLDLWLEITAFIPCKCHMDMTHVPQISSPLPLLIRARRALYIPTQSGGSPESCFAPPGIDSPPTPPPCRVGVAPVKV